MPQDLYKVLPSIMLAQNTSQYYFVIQILRTALPKVTLYCEACPKYFPVILCTTKLAQSASQLFFVLQGLSKVLPSTTLCYKACEKYSPVLLCTTKSWHKTLPVLLCTENSLHKILPSTSSTAQGGGGSFKNRKPIGEVGCCESGMAERIH